MPRIKHPPQDSTPNAGGIQKTSAATTTVESPPATANNAPAQSPGTDEGNPAGKNWGDPYRAIFTSTEKGFEMGENRRFKQRVFTFKEKPDEQTLAALKDAGFTYRAEEKSWTIPADAETRRVSDELAHEFAGYGSDRGR